MLSAGECATRRVLSSAKRSSDAEPWHEIIGVVRDIGRPAGGDASETAGIYHPAAPGGRDSGVPAGARQGAAGIIRAPTPGPCRRRRSRHPRSTTPSQLNEIRRFDLYLLSVQFWLVTGLSGGALLLSLAGIHSVLSFTVSQRTREIGLRVALGGEGWRVAATVARRPLAQVAVGILLGGVLTAAMVHAVNAGLSASGAARLLAYLALMIGVSLLAAIVPARRVLRIEPTEALKMEG